jgi:hypothetical protein
MSSFNGSIRIRDVGVGRERGPLFQHHLEVRARVSERDARLQTPHQIEAVAAAVVRKRAGINREGPPNLDLLVVHVVAARHDAHDTL